jgi:uncharacterized lipoprotein YmbA
MSRTLARRRRWIALCLVAALGGCADTPPPKLFTLVPRPAALLDGPPRSIMVATVGLPKYLDRPQIARLDHESELAVSDYERWAEALSEMTTRVVVENLSLRLPASRVYAATSTLALPADATVRIDIDGFAADDAATVSLAASFVIETAAGASPFHAERIGVRAGSTTTRDVIAAMSDALARLSDRIARAIVGL